MRKSVVKAHLLWAQRYAEELREMYGDYIASYLKTFQAEVATKTADQFILKKPHGSHSRGFFIYPSTPSHHPQTENK